MGSAATPAPQRRRAVRGSSPRPARPDCRPSNARDRARPRPAAGARSCPSTITTWWPSSADRTRSIASSWASTSTANAAASAERDQPGIADGTRSTKYGPCSCRPVVRAANSTASRVLPIPPVPVSVTRRLSCAQPIESGELVVPADDWVQRGRQVRGTRGVRGERPREPTDRGSGSNAPARAAPDPAPARARVASTSPSPAVGGEGVGRATGLVQGAHQLAPRPLAERVAPRATPPRRRCIEPRHRRPARPRTTPRPRSPASSCSRCTSPAGSAVSGTSAYGLAAERCLRLVAASAAASAGRPCPIAARASASSARRPAQRRSRLDRDRAGSRRSAARRCLRAQTSTQPGDVALQRLAGRRRQACRPQRLLEHVDRHPLARSGGEGAAGVFAPPAPIGSRLAIDQLDGAEDANLHRRRR